MHKFNLEKTDRRLSKRSRCLLSILLATMALFVAVALAQAQGNPLNFSGDFRVRYERTTRQEPGAQPDIRDPRNREVVRFRAGVSKKINGLLNFGARIATGSADDPNTTDITLGDFVDDLTISLDRVYMELTHQDLFLTAGKFGNPFLTTEMVWDGDVNPQGIAASYTFSNSRQITPKFIGVYSIVDEQTSNPDSYMWGGQVQLSAKPDPNWSLTLAGGYYDYKIKSLTNADQGDVLSNNIAPGGEAYLSDFDLLDIIAMVEYRGLSPRYPVRLVADYVKNNGAAVDEDAGFGLDLYVGQASKKSDLRFQYGYTKTETDAVLAAFSHDNTTIATNYEQHTLGVDYVAVDDTILNLTFYLYRFDQTTAGSENDFFSRIRLNALVKF